MTAPMALNIKTFARCQIVRRQIENSSDATFAISELTCRSDELNGAELEKSEQASKELLPETYPAPKKHREWSKQGRTAS